MKFVKLKDVLKDLERLKDRYEELKGLIADEVRDDQISEASAHLDELKRIQRAITQMENLDVQIEPGKEEKS